jgi:hypothetical protein
MADALKTLGMIALAVYAPFAASALGLSGFAATAFSFVLQTAGSYLLKDVGGGAGGGGGVADAGMLVNKQGNVGAIPVVYGTRRVGGSRVYLETTNGSGDPSGTEYLHMALVYAQGGVRSDGTDAVTGIEQILFQDRVAWTRTGGIDAYFSGKLNIAIWDGKNNQTRNAPLYNSEANLDWLADEWQESHRCQGVAYAYFRLKYDRDVYPGAPTILMDAIGKHIQPVNNLGVFSTDIAEMTNPANIIYDYLTSERYGKGIPASEIDIASFQTARQWCIDAGIVFNAVVDTGKTIYDNTTTLLGCSNQNLVFVNGKYALQPVKQQNYTGAFDFNTSNILGNWSITLGNKRNRFNQMKIAFFNPDLEWQPDSIIIEDAGYLAADSGVINEKSIEFPMLSDRTLAERLGTYFLKASRYQTIVSFKSTWVALKLQVGDPVTITHDVPGWTQKRFTVNSITLLPDATVDVVLEEYPADESIFLENTV